MNREASVSRPIALLALICLPVFVGSLDLTVISAVLPNVIVDLQIPIQTGGTDAAWLVSGYLLAYTVSVAMMGRLSDFIGRRRTYFIALLIFIVGSWLVAVATFAPTDWVRDIVRLIGGGRPDRSYMALYTLIGGRIVQALGAGAMVPVAMALVGDLFPPERRAVALGVVGAVDTAGWVLGHLYGGLLVQVAPWPVLFWINIPVTTAALLITWQQLKPVAEKYGEGGLSRTAWIVVGTALVALNLLAAAEIIGVAADLSVESLLRVDWLMAALLLLGIAAVVMASVNARRLQPEDVRFDAGGAVLLTLALVGLNIGLGGGGDLDTTRDFSGLQALPPYAIVMLVVAAASFVGFILVERRADTPLFDLRNFRDRNLSVASVVNLFVGFCLMVGLVSVPLFINAVFTQDLDEAALLSGLVLGALTIPMALAAVPGGLLTNRAGYRLPTALGLIVAAVGFALGLTWQADMSLWVMSGHMALAGIGLGLTVAPISTSMINAVAAPERGIASALVLVMRLVGMTIGTSAMTNYGLTRSNTLTERGVQPGMDFADLTQVAIDAASMVINEMLLIAAVVCVAALIPALFLHGKPEEENT